MKILGLENDNYKDFLLEDAVEYPSRLETIEFSPTVLKVSKDYILFRVGEFPSEIYNKKEFISLISLEADILKNPILYKNEIESRWGPENMRDIFREDLDIRIYPEKVENKEIVNEYLKENNNEQIRRMIVKYNRDKESLNIVDRDICSKMITMADLGLQKEVGILRDDLNGNNYVYSFIDINVINNRFVPIISVLEVSSLDSFSSPDRTKMKYEKYALTFRQLKGMLNKGAVGIKMEGNMFIHNCNGRDILEQGIGNLVI